jgi:general secretion pathway protein F
MPRYIYTAKSEPHKTVQGELDAESEQEVIQKLNRMGYVCLSVTAEDLTLDKPHLLQLKKVSSRDLLLFTRQLSGLIESGVNLLNSLTIVSEQTQNKYLRAVIRDISTRIKDGKSLSESFAAHPYLFSNLYTSLLHSGEVGGSLEQVLKNLADFLEKDEEFKNSVRMALIYPLFVFCVGAATVLVLLTFVIPKLVTMFEDMGQVLPLPTKLLIMVSGSVRQYWWLGLAGIGTLVFLFKRTLRNPAQRLLWDRFRLRIALWGEITLKTEVSRMMHTLSLLISSGMPIVSGLVVTSSVIENQALRLELQKFKEEISNGVSFSRCLKESPLFPAFVTNIVGVGEETGTLEKSLLRISSEYEKSVDRSLKTFTQLLEPIIILSMGLIVGFIVVAMLLPIFQINVMVK